MFIPIVNYIDEDMIEKRGPILRLQPTSKSDALISGAVIALEEYDDYEQFGSMSMPKEFKSPHENQAYTTEDEVMSVYYKGKLIANVYAFYTS